MTPTPDSLEGRGALLALAREHLQAADAGRGGLLVVRGEAGIGKTVLAEVIVAEARARGFRVLVGRAWDGAESAAYFPLRSGLRALGVAPTASTHADSDAFGLWEDLLEALAAETARAPLLWWVEDVHAADKLTIELLAFLARPLHALRAVALATVRVGDLGVSDVVQQQLARLAREGTVLDVGRLGEKEVASVVSRITGQPLPARAAAAWVARTGGNPLFVVECAKAVRAGRNAENALPGTVVQLVSERLRFLGAATRSALEYGAVQGTEFTAATASRLADQLPSAIIDALLPALRSELLQELAPGRFLFGHALVREAILEGMDPARRRLAHARADELLGELGDRPDLAVERAQHAIRALGLLTDEHVEDRVRGAVTVLCADGAPDRAYGLWRRWLDARRSAPDIGLLLESARLASAAGSSDEAHGHALAAAALARRDGDVARFAEAALLMGARSRPGVIESSHVQILEEALSKLDAHPALRSRVKVRLAAALQPSRDPQVPVAMAREALATARTIGDPPLLREVLLQAGAAFSYFVDASEMVDPSRELLALAEAAGDFAVALRAGSRLATAHLELGDFGAYDAAVDALLAQARSVGHPSATWRAWLLGSQRALARGQFEESERFIIEVEEGGALVDDAALTFSLRAHQLPRVLALDDEDRVREAVTTTLPALATLAGDYGPTILGLFALRLEDRASVARNLPGMTWLADVVPPTAPLQGLIGEAVAFAGSVEQRKKWLSRLLPLADRQVQSPIPLIYEGPVARVIGLLEQSLGNLEQADRRLEGSARTCRENGLRPGSPGCCSSSGGCGSPAVGATRRERPCERPRPSPRRSA